MRESSETWFDHEKLEVYKEAIAFIAWLSALLEGTVRLGDVKDQLDRASTSIPLNIAEGNGKYAPKDKCRFFDIAHGSALECAAGLDVLVAKRKLKADDIRPGKESLQKVVRMLIGLIKKAFNPGVRKRHIATLNLSPALALTPLPNLALPLTLSPFQAGQSCTPSS
jgi:four helix bundle protein